MRGWCQWALRHLVRSRETNALTPLAVTNLANIGFSGTVGPKGSRRFEFRKALLHYPSNKTRCRPKNTYLTERGYQRTGPWALGDGRWAGLVWAGREKRARTTRLRIFGPTPTPRIFGGKQVDPPVRDFWREIGNPTDLGFLSDCASRVQSPFSFYIRSTGFFC